jgi:flagellar biosynthesis/type III secretory pathway M-ring protein FliF/YscJ
MNYPRFKLLGAIGIAVLLALAGGLIMLRRKSAAAKKKAAAPATMKQASLQAASLSDVPSTREELERQIQERLEQSANEHARKEAEALMNLQLPDTNTKKSEVLTKHLTAEAKKDPAAVAQVIRAWLDADKHEY